VCIGGSWMELSKTDQIASYDRRPAGAAAALSATALACSPQGDARRPRVDGKFVYRGAQKVYLRGFTYGTFTPNEAGDEFSDQPRVERDFELMAAHGANAVRTYTVPPRWLLDAAARHGLMVMVGIPWEQHVA